MIEPGKHPKVTVLQNDLDSLQKAVSIGADYQGVIEIVPLGNGDCILCNERMPRLKCFAFIAHVS